MTALAATPALTRLVLRRDRVRLPVWVLGVAGLLLSSVASVTSLYRTEQDRLTYTAAVGDNPVAVVMGGPGAGLPSLGAIVVFEISVTGYVAVGLMSVFLVVRHTRAEEEAGRTELLRAGAVGRHAAPAAALGVVTAANLAVAAIVLAGMLLAGLGTVGSLALSASFLVFGIAMAAVGLLAAQVTEHSRGATGIGAAVLAGFFVLRAAGDVGDGTLSLASPMGWALAVRPFAGERWVVLLAPLLLAGLLVAVALLLVGHRDVGAGLVAPRPGRPAASRWLAGPGGLAVRQHRAALAGWAVGLLLLGLAYGSVGEAVEDLVADNAALAEFVAATGTDIVDAFFALAASMMALMSAGFALQATTRMRAEETVGRLEPLLATAVSRWRWAGAHLLVAVAGSALVLLLSGLGLGLSHAALTGDPGQIPRLLLAPVVYAPALWTLVGLAMLLFGVAPRAGSAVWAALAGCAFVLLLGRALNLPTWVVDLSPFQHVPQVPAQPLSLGALGALTGLAVLLAVMGLAGWRHRDVG